MTNAKVRGVEPRLRRTTRPLRLEQRAGGVSALRFRGGDPRLLTRAFPCGHAQLLSSSQHTSCSKPKSWGDGVSPLLALQRANSRSRASAPSASRETQKSPSARSSPSLSPPPQSSPADPARPGCPSSPFHLPRLLRPLLPPISTPSSSPTSALGALRSGHSTPQAGLLASGRELSG